MWASNMYTNFLTNKTVLNGPSTQKHYILNFHINELIYILTYHNVIMIIGTNKTRLLSLGLQWAAEPWDYYYYYL